MILFLDNLTVKKWDDDVFTYMNTINMFIESPLLTYRPAFGGNWQPSSTAFVRLKDHSAARGIIRLLLVVKTALTARAKGEQSPTPPDRRKEESGPWSVFRCVCFCLVINMNTMKNNQIHLNVSGNIPFMDAMGLVHGYLNGKVLGNSCLCLLPLVWTCIASASNFSEQLGKEPGDRRNYAPVELLITSWIAAILPIGCVSKLHSAPGRLNLRCSLWRCGFFFFFGQVLHILLRPFERNQSIQQNCSATWCGNMEICCFWHMFHFWETTDT